MRCMKLPPLSREGARRQVPLLADRQRGGFLLSLAFLFKFEINRAHFLHVC